MGAHGICLYDIQSYNTPPPHTHTHSLSLSLSLEIITEETLARHNYKM